MLIRIAARKSDLARIQAYQVGEALLRAWPDVQVAYQFSTSLGDQNQTDPLWQMPEKGVFTQDLTKALLRGECDLVVHSWKDLPTEERVETEIAATLPRADAHDVLLVRKDQIHQFKNGSDFRIYSSSPRRAYSLGSFLKWSLPMQVNPIFLPVRGNIATRLKKYLQDDVHAIVVAKAALDRLLATQADEFSESRAIIREALKMSRFQVVPLSQGPTAAAQGALAIEVSRTSPNYSALLSRLQKINCAITFQNVSDERSILRSYGGGCHQKIGVTKITRPFGHIQYLRGLTDAGQVLDQTDLDSSQDLILKSQLQAFRKINVRADEIFPVQMSENIFYTRQARDFQADVLQGRDLLVSRYEAWPDHYVPALEQLVWVSGNRSWRKLAQDGVWVSGAQDSLGEDEPIAVDLLLGRNTNFIKLSHSEMEGESRFELMPVYDLVDRDDIPDLSHIRYFFWPSYSQFMRALRRSPSIRSAHHACGVGNTYKLLRRELGEGASLTPFLNYRLWRNQFDVTV